MSCVLRRLQRHWLSSNSQCLRSYCSQFDVGRYSQQFGHEDLQSSDEKKDRVHQVFEEVAKNYDTMNDVMSFGIHRQWKNHFTSLIKQPEGKAILDMAGGTGDIGLRLALRCTRDQSLPNIMICDINEDMLAIGRQKAAKLNIDYRIKFQKEDAGALSFSDNSFDVYTIAFGIRNVPRLDVALAEAYRVLKPGGRFLCLEFSPLPASPTRPFNCLYQAFTTNVIPPLGHVIAGSYESYQYLVESIERFPDAKAFSELIEQSGLDCVTQKPLTGGIVRIHSAFKF